MMRNMEEVNLKEMSMWKPAKTRKWTFPTLKMHNKCTNNDFKTFLC